MKTVKKPNSNIHKYLHLIGVSHQECLIYGLIVNNRYERIALKSVFPKYNFDTLRRLLLSGKLAFAKYPGKKDAFLVLTSCSLDIIRSINSFRERTID